MSGNVTRGGERFFRDEVHCGREAMSGDGYPGLAGPGLVGGLVSVLGAHVAPGAGAAALGFFHEAFAQLLQGAEDLHALVQVVGRVLPDGFELLGILAGQHGEPGGGKAHAESTTAREDQHGAGANAGENQCLLPVLHSSPRTL